MSKKRYVSNLVPALPMENADNRRQLLSWKKVGETSCYSLHKCSFNYINQLIKAF